MGHKDDSLAAWREFVEHFRATDRSARSLILDLKDVNPREWFSWKDSIHDAIQALRVVQHLGKQIIRSDPSNSDTAYRACTAAALREAALTLLRLKFVEISSHRHAAVENLKDARNALRIAEEFIDGLKRRPLRRRCAAIKNRILRHEKTVGFEDLRTALYETDRAINTIMMSILIVLARAKSKHKTLDSLLGSKIEDVVAHVQQDVPLDRIELADLARLAFAITNTRVTLLAFRVNAATSRCRAYLHVLEANVIYCTSTLQMSFRRREECLKRTRSSISASRAAERKALELIITYPIRALVGTTEQANTLPLASWVTEIPGYFARRGMRKRLTRKVRQTTLR